MALVVGPTQEKALPAVNPQAHHRLQFRFPLDSFGDHLAVRLSGERDNGGQGGLFRRFPSTRETRERSTLRKSGATSRTACQSTWPVISDTTSCGASPHWRSHSAGSPLTKAGSAKDLGVTWRKSLHPGGRDRPRRNASSRQIRPAQPAHPPRQQTITAPRATARSHGSATRSFAVPGAGRGPSAASVPHVFHVFGYTAGT